MIGERLSDLRKDRGLTQQQLAEILHLTKHNISAYEREHNEAPDNVKIAIADYFGVSVDYLLGLTDLPDAYEKPRSTLTLDADFPPELKPVLQAIIDALSLANRKSPRAVSHALSQAIQSSARLLSRIAADDESIPDNDGCKDTSGDSPLGGDAEAF